MEVWRWGSEFRSASREETENPAATAWQRRRRGTCRCLKIAACRFYAPRVESWRIFRRDDRLHRDLEPSGFHIEHAPDDFVVHAVVAVGDVVPGTSDLAPGRLGMAGAQIFRQPLYGFADDLDEALAEHLFAPVGLEFFPRRLGPQGERLVAQFHDLLQRE